MQSMHKQRKARQIDVFCCCLFSHYLADNGKKSHQGTLDSLDRILRETCHLLSESVYERERGKRQRTNGDVCRTRVHQQRQKMKKSQWTSVKVQLVQTLCQSDSDQMSNCDSCCHWHRFFGRSERQCSHKRSPYKFNYRFFSLVLTDTRQDACRESLWLPLSRLCNQRSSSFDSFRTVQETMPSCERDTVPRSSRGKAISCAMEETLSTN